MTFLQAQSRVTHLRDVIEAHNKKYYVDNAPLISDFEFDLLMSELESIEKKYPKLVAPDSPTQRVGSDSVPEKESGFLQYPHQYPMLSLSNTYSESDLLEFDLRIRKSIEVPFSYVCELKFDGTAICLTYQKGKLVRALTRGDGAVGDDVLQNVLTITEVPAQLKGSGFPELFEIRGEILLPFVAFTRINEKRQKENEPLFANPRNAAAGTLKMLNSEEVAKRGLCCYLYHLLGDALPVYLHSGLLEKAASWGLPVLGALPIDNVLEETSICCDTIQEALHFIHQWGEKRFSLPFAIDGMVVKVNELSVQQALGMTAKSPRWATAYKYKAEQAQTRILSVDYQVGRTGSITPVANLEPVLLSGTVVKRASLHNADQISLLDIRIHDTVVVEKGGEIIPKIIASLPELRLADSLPIPFITRCPQCDTPLIKEEQEVKSFCPNIWECPPQIKGRILHFMSRKAMNILGGEALVEQLYNKKMVTKVSDLYRITKEQLLTLDNFGEKSAENLLESILASKSVPFSRVLFALGIRHIGETTAKSLSSDFASLDAIEQASGEMLQSSRDVGEVLVQSIRSFFAHPQNQITIRALKEAGIQLESKTPQLIPFPHPLTDSNTLSPSLTLAGLQFVITGIFTISREDIKTTIEQHGGKVQSQPSAQTDYLVCGTNPGPSKVTKASKFNIKIISQDELTSLTNKTNELSNPKVIKNI